MGIKAIKGTRDIFGINIKKWRYVESKIFDYAKRYNYSEIRLPTFESTELFSRGIGDATDIVNKEMYSFKDKGDRSITLRPEGTASVVRAYIENKMYIDKGVEKLFYIGSIFRQERPQKGRFREFYQFGIENIGSLFPVADAEVISFAYMLYKELGLKSIEVELNSIGCSECRIKYIKALKKYLEPNLDDLCPICKERYNTNPLRILDCKNKICKDIIENAPTTIDYICDECKKHFDKLIAYLNVLKIPFIINGKLVRGLDYYSKTVFEITSGRLGSQNAIAAGGRYDYLIGMFYSNEIPAVGFAGGIDRLILLMEEEGLFDDFKEDIPDVFVITVGEDSKFRAIEVVSELRSRGYSVDIDFMCRSIKSQLRKADKLGIKNILIIGIEEIQKGIIIYKNMEKHFQKEIDINNYDEIDKIME